MDSDARADRLGACAAARHGTRHAYDQYGCRCPEAYEDIRRNWRRRLPPGQHQAGPKDRDPHIDLIAVERACRGEPVPLTIAERGEAIRRLTARGHSARAIAKLLGLAQRSVQRYRAGLIHHARPHTVDGVCASLWTSPLAEPSTPRSVQKGRSERPDLSTDPSTGLSRHVGGVAA